jgi:hypothetical protein
VKFRALTAFRWPRTDPLLWGSPHHVAPAKKQGLPLTRIYFPRRVTDEARTRHLPSRATIRCNPLQYVLPRPVIWLIYRVFGDLAEHACSLRTSLD